MRKITFVAAVTAALVAGGVTGSAIATSQSDPAFTPGTADMRADRTDVAPYPYPTNAAGQTYGSLADATSEHSKPDLILVELSDGSNGYIRSDEFDAWADGSPSNPAEAARQSRDAASSAPKVFEVVAADGRTEIGEWSPGSQ